MYLRRFMSTLTAVCFMSVMIALSGGRAYATDVCGPVFSNTAWDIAGSPYIVKCGIVVKAGAMLTIDPGVEVLFNGAYFIRVEDGGGLIAEGTEADMITFTSNQAAPAGGDWGGIEYQAGSLGRLIYCNIEYAGYGGLGGIHVANNGTIIDHCKISHCYGGLGGISAYYADNLQISNNTISSNYASTWNGGISCSYSTVSITGNIITGNNAALSSGGIGCGHATVSISNNTISGNSAAVHGGGIVGSYSAITISNNTINSNTAKEHGGGIYTDHGTVNITNNTINGNSAATKAGGGIITFYSTVNITNNTVSGNSAAYGGGGIRHWYGTATITNNTVNSNSAAYGGGVCTGYGTATISNNIIADNSAAVLGGGIYTHDNNAQISGNTLQNNTAGTGYGIYIVSGAPVVTGNNLLNPGGYEVYNDSTSDVEASGNWWGTTEQWQIMDKIYDWYDDTAKGEVLFYPWADSYNNLVNIASFTANPVQVISGDPVSFTDLSFGDISLWRWEFGDGQISRDQNPIHVYDRAGEYTVTLAIGGAGGNDTVTMVDYIKVVDPVSISVTLNQAAFITGDTLTAEYQLTNLGPNQVQVELKLWEVFPTKRTDPLAHPHTRVILAPYATAADTFYSHTFDGSEPAGGYKIGARPIDMITGKTYADDIKPFTFTP